MLETFRLDNLTKIAIFAYPSDLCFFDAVIHLHDDRLHDFSEIDPQ